MAKAPTRPVGTNGITAGRPVITGRRHVISAGHYLAAQAGFQILEAGGNAIDAGVAAGITLGVVQPDIVNVAGVAPIILYDAKSQKVITVSGLGHWPMAITADHFMKKHGGKIPRGIERTIVPAAPDAWIQTLARYGTMTFGEVAAAATRLARDGFATHALLAETIATHAKDYAEWEGNRAIYLPAGKPPKAGDLFVQTDLAGSLQYMIDQEKAASTKGRIGALEAARAAFYTGDIGRAIVAYHERNGGFLAMSDLAEFRSGFEKPASVPFGDFTLFTCGPWCQGPVVAQMLRLVEASGAHKHGPTSFEYVHKLTEIMKLAFADRHAYYGDPRFIDVPLQRLLSKDYAEERARLVRLDKAANGMPAPGLGDTPQARALGMIGSKPQLPMDTSYVCVVDSKGNVFSATPSDTSYNVPVVPGTGLAPSGRGSQSWADPRIAASVAPGKRPRLTPNPALVMGPGGRAIPFGTPGGDVQAQAMVQTLINVIVRGMDPQAAIEAPRFATYSFPDSFEPHTYVPNRLALEARLPQALADRLAEVGHEIEWWPDFTWLAGAMCLIDKDGQSGLIKGGADPRRASYALGW